MSYIERNVEVLQLLVSAIGLISLFLIFVQLAQTTKWNRINTQHTLTDSLPSYELERKVWQLLEDQEADPSDVISEEVARRLFDNHEHLLLLKTYFNAFEDYCTAVQLRLVDEQYARRAHRSFIIDKYRIFRHFIDISRTKTGNEKLYVELQSIAEKWKAE